MRRRVWTDFCHDLKSLRPVAGRSCPVVPKRSSESTLAMMSSDSPMMKSSSGIACGEIDIERSTVSIKRLNYSHEN